MSSSTLLVVSCGLALLVAVNGCNLGTGIDVKTLEKQTLEICLKLTDMRTEEQESCDPSADDPTYDMVYKFLDGSGNQLRVKFPVFYDTADFCLKVRLGFQYASQQNIRIGGNYRQRCFQNGAVNTPTNVSVNNDHVADDVVPFCAVGGSNSISTTMDVSNRIVRCESDENVATLTTIIKVDVTKDKGAAAKVNCKLTIRSGEYRNIAKTEYKLRSDCRDTRRVEVGINSPKLSSDGINVTVKCRLVRKGVKTLTSKFVEKQV